MNHAYRLIWCDIRQTWLAVAEFVPSRGKRSAGAVLLLAASSAFAQPPSPSELPTGGQLATGAASIQQTGNSLNINQSSDKAAINWNTFNVGSNASVNFNQPNSHSVTLNRVQDANPSQIYGQINANGQVFISNANGVYFAPSASVNVEGLTATTGNISNADFMAGKTGFKNTDSSGSVVNDGSINANLGGYVALLAPEVRNNGFIIAKSGTVALAAGDGFELQFTSNNKLNNIRVEASAIKALVENGKAVQAPDGLIILSAQAANHLQGGGIINNSGSLEANGLVNDGGRIVLTASDSIDHTGSISADAASNASGHGGQISLIADLANSSSKTQINGSLSAKGGELGGDGGFIETSAAKVKIGHNSQINTRAAQGKTGQWLIDPIDFIVSSGANGDISGADLGTQISSNDVTIATDNTEGTDNGDVIINDAVNWSTNKLTISAYRNIDINSRLTATNNGKLALQYGQGAVAASNTATYNIQAPVNLDAGQNFSTKLGSDGTTQNYTVVTDLNSLQAINSSDNYALGANIDATDTRNWNSGSGFIPLYKFNSSFDGLGHTISNLYIDYIFDEMDFMNPSPYPTGLFSRFYNGNLQNIGLINADISSNSYYTGGLVGDLNGANINNTFSQGTIRCNDSSGGLIGLSASSTITNSYSTGLVDSPNGNYAGGIAGALNSTKVTNVYSSATVNGYHYVGGLFGDVYYQNNITKSYSTGAVTGHDYIGGLVGSLGMSTLSNVYSSSEVTGINDVGGLIGIIGQTTINNSYSTGKVTGTSNAGGLVGNNAGNSVSNNSYWDTVSSGQSTSALGIGKTTAEMQAKATYSDWDFNSIWGLSSGYPCLLGPGCSNATPIYIRLISGGSSIYGDTPLFNYGLFDAASDGNQINDAQATGIATWNNAPTASSGAGTYHLTYNNGIVLGNTAYSFSAGSAVDWLVNARPITVTVDDASRYYGSPNPTTGSSKITSGNLVNGDVLSTVSVSSSASGTTDAGQNTALVGSNQLFSQGSAANYAISYVDGLLSIDRRPITVRADDVSRYYGSDNPSTVNTMLIEGTLANNDQLSKATANSAATNTTDAGQTAALIASDQSFSFGQASNYAISYENGLLTVTKRPITVKAEDVSRYYGSDNPNTVNTLLIEGTLANNDQLSQATANSAATNTTDAGQTASLIASDQSFSLGKASNYAISYQNGLLTVTKRPITVKADDVSRLYGEQNPNTGSTTIVEGSLANNDKLSSASLYSLANQFTAGGQRVKLDAEQQTFSLGNANNYDITYREGVLTVSPRVLTVTARDTSKTYDGLTFSGGNGVDYSGFLNGDTPESLNGMLSYSGNSQGANNPGTYTIKPTGLSSESYVLNIVDGVLTVRPAPLPPPQTVIVPQLVSSTNINTPPAETIDPGNSGITPKTNVIVSKKKK